VIIHAVKLIVDLCSVATAQMLVVPVVALDDAKDAIPLAKALLVSESPESSSAKRGNSY
jgi:hypothetical protein